MELVIKPVLLCIVGIILISIVRRVSPEFAPLISVICAVMLIAYVTPYIKTVYDALLFFQNRFSMLSEIIKLTVKIIGISLLCEFASQLCADNGEKFLADKVNFAGKILILSIISPIVISFMEGIFDKLNLL